MAIVAIKQPNERLMMFSSVSSCPIKMNLTEKEFIQLYIDLEKDCSYKTPEQSKQDAIYACTEHLYPWEEFYERFIPMYGYEDEQDQIKEIESKCCLVFKEDE